MTQLLERMIKVRDRVKIRKQPQTQRDVFNKAKQRMDKVSTRIQKRKPQFFSQANEALGGWQPGNRITKIMPVDFGKRRGSEKKTEELDFSMSVQAP